MRFFFSNNSNKCDIINSNLHEARKFLTILNQIELIDSSGVIAKFHKQKVVVIFVRFYFIHKRELRSSTSTQTMLMFN